jgi:hypothetical protein
MKLIRLRRLRNFRVTPAEIFSLSIAICSEIGTAVDSIEDARADGVVTEDEVTAIATKIANTLIPKIVHILKD